MVMNHFGGYTLKRKIAAGGMAEVYLATRTSIEGFEKQVAIKRILEHLTDEANFRTMFLDEARLAAKLNHPNIVQIFDMGEANNRLFLAMEFIDGQSLARILKQCGAHDVRFPLEIAVHVVSELCLGLDYAHEFVDQDGRHLNIVHRDISPQNIMASQDGSIKIVDFGIAKAASNLNRSKAISIKGKVKYMSPEQVLGKEALDRRSDIYSTGIVLFEMLTGHVPHMSLNELALMEEIVTQQAPDPREFSPEIPEELALIVNKVLQRDRVQRYPNGRELRAEFTRFLGNQNLLADAYALKDFLQDLAKPGGPTAREAPSDTPEVESPTPADESPFRIRKIWILAGFSLLAFALGFFVMFAQQDQEPTDPVDPTTRHDTTWSKVQKAIHKKQEKEDLRAVFFDRWNQGRKFAEDSDLLIEAKLELEEAERIAKNITISDSIRKELKTLLNKTRKTIEKRDRLKQRMKHIQKNMEAQKLEDTIIPVPYEKSLGDEHSKVKASQTLRDRAIRLHKRAHFQRAIALYREAYKLNPDDHDLIRLTAAAYESSGDTKSSLKSYTKYVNCCPNCKHTRSVEKILEKKHVQNSMNR